MKKFYSKPQIHTYIVRVESLLNADSPGYQSGLEMESKKADSFEDDQFETSLSHNTLWDDSKE